MKLFNWRKRANKKFFTNHFPRWKNAKFCVLVILQAMIALTFNNHAFSQQITETLEQRVQILENYVATIQPTLAELSEALNNSIREYTQGLEASLENYSRKLQMSLDERLSKLDQSTIILNPYTQTYQTIETNTGIFLVAVERVESIEGGFRLHLNIGNPNYADYRDFKLKFFWGEPWEGENIVSYSAWRKALNGTEFTFNGRIEKGMWNNMTVDLASSDGRRELGYLECEMSVSAIELGYK